VARTDARYRSAYNMTLDLLGPLQRGGSLPSELAMADDLKVSRTTVRTVLRNLDDAGIIRWQGRDKTLIRPPEPADRLPETEAQLSHEELEGRFLDWVLRFDVPAGTPLNVAQLAKRFSVPTHSLQAFLASLGQFGLVERRPRGGWQLLGFTAEYAVELSDFRAVLELNAMRVLTMLPPDDPIWPRIDRLEAQHRTLLSRIETNYHDFSRLDEQFHTALNGVVRNRFVSEFQKVISLIFHYHYQWDKTEERRRNEAAIGEHLAIIAALKARDPAAAEQAARSHLITSKETLLASLRDHRLA
jgi:DNA-binding GntR family transcriptional regulator